MKFAFFFLLTFGVNACYSQSVDASGKYDPKQDTTFYLSKDVEIHASYPGGEKQWQNFVQRYMYNPNETTEKVIVSVQFGVDRGGKPCRIEILSGPTNGIYRSEAKRLIKKAGIWVPAVNNGHMVNSYRILDIEFPPLQQ